MAGKAVKNEPNFLESIVLYSVYKTDQRSSHFRNSSWILTTTLVLSVLVLLWICCATVATAVEQYVPSEVLHFRTTVFQIYSLLLLCYSCLETKKYLGEVLLERGVF